MATAGKAAAATAKSGWRYLVGKWAYESSYFPQLGLRYDDTLRETEDVKEALRRLPEPVFDARMFRISRALNLSMTKTVLPKDEWTKYDEDTRYLKSILDDVIAERKEKREWDRK